jgi:hypothetical protein
MELRKERRWAEVRSALAREVAKCMREVQEAKDRNCCRAVE